MAANKTDVKVAAITTTTTAVVETPKTEDKAPKTEAPKTEAKAEAPKAGKKEVSNLPAIKDAIVYAYDTLHNSRALSKQDFEDVGLTEQALTQWKEYVEELRKAANAYVDLAADKNASDQKINAALGAAWAEWRRVLKQGTEQDFNKTMFVRKADVPVFIAGMCGTKLQKTARARVLAHTTAADFRRSIETLIGIRMAGNAILTEEQRDTISAYESAKHTVKTKTEALEGYERNKVHIQGLNEKLAALKAVLAEKEALADKYNYSEEDRKKETGKLSSDVKAVEKEIDAANESIKKANKTIASKEEDYKKIIALIKPIVGDSFDEEK